MFSCDTDEGIVYYVFMTNTSLVYIHLSWLFHSARRDIKVRMIQKHKSHLMFPKYQALCDPIKISSTVLLNSVTRALLKPDDLLLSTRSKLLSFLNWISMKLFLKCLEARRGLTYKTTKLLLCFSLEMKLEAEKISIVNITDHKKIEEYDTSNIRYDH